MPGNYLFTMNNSPQFSKWDHFKASWAMWRKEPRALLWIGFSVSLCVLLAAFLVLKNPRPQGYEPATVTRIDDLVYEDGLRRRIMVVT